MTTPHSSNSLPSNLTRHVLTLLCDDRPGIVHAVARGLLDIDGNIVESAQYSDSNSGLFCMRTVVESATVAESSRVAAAVRERLDTRGLTMRVRLELDRPRILILVSKFDHCLVDLLYRWRTRALHVEILLIVSNHMSCEDVANQHGIPFVHLPITPDSKLEQERHLRDLIDSHRIDLVVLARYMQILSDDLCRHLRGRAINIHHSFLPGFKGAKPYHQAHARGVKLVGATAHFVSADLDEGPIIEQDAVRVDHAHSVEDLVALGADIERLVLARAVRLWAEDRIFLIGHKTVLFK